MGVGVGEGVWVLNFCTATPYRAKCIDKEERANECVTGRRDRYCVSAWVRQGDVCIRVKEERQSVNADRWDVL